MTRDGDKSLANEVKGGDKILRPGDLFVRRNDHEKIFGLIVADDRSYYKVQELEYTYGKQRIHQNEGKVYYLRKDYGTWERV